MNSSLFQLAFLAGGTYLAYQYIEGTPTDTTPLSGLTPSREPLKGEPGSIGPGKGPVKQPPPPGKTPITKPLTPLAPATQPLKPLGGAAGYCFGVTDKAFAPYTPNVKNPCPDQKWGWSMIDNPTALQCKTYVGSDYLPAMGGCISSNSPGKTLFILRNNIIQ